MDVGIAFDLKSDFIMPEDAPEDWLEEYDSHQTVSALVDAISAAGHRPRLLGGGRQLVAAVLASAPDLVFNIAEGNGGRAREAQVPSILETLHVPFTHSDPLALAISQHKWLAKKLVAEAGVATPRGVVAGGPALPDIDGLRYPVFVKPLFEGSSVGIRRSSRVDSAAELADWLVHLQETYRQPVLVEEFLPGQELTVGVVGTGAAARSIGTMEIAPTDGNVQGFVYSLEVKRNYEAEVRYLMPPALPPHLVAEAESAAVAAHRVLGCRDVSRVDLRIDANGRPSFIEINPLPGLHPVSSDIVILARGHGWTYDGLVAAILESALERHPELADQGPSRLGPVQPGRTAGFRS